MTLFSSPIVLVLVGVIGLLIGLLVGFLFIDRDAKKSRAANIPEEFTRDGFLEISRMLYSPTKKRIVTGLDGEFFKEAKDMTADQHTRLSKVLRIWSEWNNVPGSPAEETETPAVETLEPPSPETKENAPAEGLAATPAEVSRAEVPDEEAPAETPTPEAEAAVFSTDVVSPAEPLAWAPFVEESATSETPVQEAPEEPAAEPAPLEAPVVEEKNLTIVEQINQTLQSMLHGTAYEFRGLTLEDDKQNGVLVYAGSEKFNGIEAVPYADAQELIRNAVTEWERKYESEQNKPVQG